MTRADVARRAKVSPALVSYVLNDGPRAVSAEARARIEEAIHALGYRPNSIAQALRGASTRSIGLLIPSAVNRFFGELTTEIESELFRRGNTLAIGMSDDDPAREARYIDMLVDRRVDGIMVISSRSRDSLARLADSRTPAIVLDRVPAVLPVSSVSVDNAHGISLAFAHLREHGARSIGCIGGRIGTESADERVSAWHDLLSPEERCVSDDLLVRSDFTEEGGYEAMTELLSRPALPDAMIVSSDAQSFGALRAIADHGLALPDDLRLVSFDGTRSTGFSVPELTVVRQPTARIARSAVDALFEAIASPETPLTRHRLPGELVIGTSCGCPTTRTVPGRALGPERRRGRLLSDA